MKPVHFNESYVQLIKKYKSYFATCIKGLCLALVAQIGSTIYLATIYDVKIEMRYIFLVLQTTPAISALIIEQATIFSAIAIGVYSLLPLFKRNLEIQAACIFGWLHITSLGATPLVKPWWVSSFNLAPQPWMYALVIVGLVGFNAHLIRLTSLYQLETSRMKVPLRP